MNNDRIATAWRNITPYLFATLVWIIAASCTSAPPVVEAPDIDEGMKRQEAEEKEAGEASEEPERGAEQESEKKEARTAKALSEEPLPPQELSEEKRRRLAKILESMSYLVYPGEDDADSSAAREAVEAANGYLAEKNLGFVPYEQVRRFLRERADLYQNETDGRISSLRWSAETFDSDIYVELMLNTKTSKEGNSYFATSAVSLLFFHTSTGEEWARSSSASPSATMSTKSIRDAVDGSVKETVRRAMENGLESLRSSGFQRLRDGLPYTIELESTYNDETLAKFVKRFEKEVEFIERTKTTSERTIYEIRFIGSVTELEESVFETAEQVHGLEDMFLVYQRGDTIAFNTGM